MSRRTLTPRLTCRTAVGLAALFLSAGVLASRVRTIAREPRVPLGPRVAQLMHNRMLALQVQAYARTKAAFDSVAREMARRNARTWPVSFIREEYAWPADVGRTTHCDGVR